MPKKKLVDMTEINIFLVKYSLIFVMKTRLKTMKNKFLARAKKHISVTRSITLQTSETPSHSTARSGLLSTQLRPPPWQL